MLNITKFLFLSSVIPFISLFTGCNSAKVETIQTIQIETQEQTQSDNSQNQTIIEKNEISYEEKIPEEDLDFEILTTSDPVSSQSSLDQAAANSTSLQSSLDQADDFVSPLIYSAGKHTDKELYKFFCAHSKENHFNARKIAKIYIEECATEGINSDVAFVQMCHETNFLRFGNLVKKEWNNFCGLGAINAEQPGLQFKTMRLGVRAHIQHLHAYATTEDINLNNECIDPRYKYVRPRAKATTVEGLSGTWAADKMYAEKLVKYLKELENF